MSRNINAGGKVLLGAFATMLLGGTALSQEWPPAFQPLPETIEVLTPEETLETFTLPPGYSASVVASEPLIEDSVVMQWDYQGRMWLVETTYMKSFEELTAVEPSSNIIILSDTDGDGVMDDRTVFAEGLTLPRSLLILEPGKVIVGEPPNILFMEDTDGDDVADVTTTLTEGNYGPRGGSFEHNPNGMFWNIDNRIYNAYLDEVYTWNGEALDGVPGISISQWGVTSDDEGHLFRQGNSAAPSMSYVADYYYGRNSIFERERGADEWIAGPTRDANKVWPARPTPGVNRGYQVGTLDPRGALYALTSAGGAGTYRGTALADGDYGNIFVPEPAANLITMSTLTDSGAGIFLRKAYETADFLTSTDERFRPVFTATGPDGAFYVLDLYHGIIQDGQYLTNYLKDWVDQHDLGQNGDATARVYRIEHEEGEASEIIDLTAASTDELVALLDHENTWYRDHAQRLMVVQQKTEATDALVAMVGNEEAGIGRLHALWTLDGLDTAPKDLVLDIINNGDDSVLRAAALRVSENWLAEGDADAIAAVQGMIGDTNNDWRLIYQLAASAGEIEADNRLEIMVDIIETYGSDYIALDAALSGVRAEEVTPLLDALMSVEYQSPAAMRALTTVATAQVRNGSAEDVSAMLEAIGNTETDGWKREAALAGVEIVLAGADDAGQAPSLERDGMPSGPRNVDNLGDTFFAEYRDGVNAAEDEYNATREAAAAPTGALSEVEGVPNLTLSEEPTSFLALQQDEALGERVTAVAPLIVWGQ
jgi:hypothetical protein